jgi:hypothetical protein
MMCRIQRNTPFAFGIAVVLFSAAACFVSISTASADELERSAQESKDKYAADLKQLAAWCEEKGLKEEARKTRAALGPDDPMKFYVPALPVEVGPPKLPEGASPAAMEWDQKLNRLRKEHSIALYDFARRAAGSNRPGLALELALDAIRANADNETVRRLFGYQKFQNQWHTNYEAKKLRQGMVWHEKFGWLQKAYVKRYEDGQRYRNGKWITAAEDAAAHVDIDSGWDIETEHYLVRTDHSLEAGVALGEKLELLRRLWGQLFIRYYASENDVIALFDGRAKTQNSQTGRHRVFYFRDRDEYNKWLEKDVPGIAISIGYYSADARTAFFFAGKDSDDRTLYHEATHQLFHESRPVSPKVGRLANFWIIEGIATYMESLKVADGYYELGGFDDERMLAARTRLVRDNFYIPFIDLVGYGMEKLQKAPDIATIYSQMAGQTHFLVHYDHGRYRDALVTYLAIVYSGHDSEQTLSKITGENYGELDKQYKEFMEKGDGKTAGGTP